jgi:hypothetical protein
LHTIGREERKEKAKEERKRGETRAKEATFSIYLRKAKPFCKDATHTCKKKAFL